ncbi:ArsR/SmtB family transcription factor [Ferrovibrio sp.]|uniref:ArsR/SmtB family transcription factor n=1 Tax=Ferrovibrio sp. TaxID=1917215 RepID=UPI003D27F0BF
MKDHLHIPPTGTAKAHSTGINTPGVQAAGPHVPGADTPPGFDAAMAAEVAQLADIFHLLGDPSRLRLLLACLSRAWPATELATYCGLSPQAASHHLRLLKAARLVRAERDGRSIRYTAADDHVRHMLRDMIEHMAEEREAP